MGESIGMELLYWWGTALVIAAVFLAALAAFNRPLFKPRKTQKSPEEMTPRG